MTTTTLAAEAPGDLAGFGGVERDLAARHRHAVARENRFGLILVDFHDGRKLLMLIAKPTFVNATRRRRARMTAPVLDSQLERPASFVTPRDRAACVSLVTQQ